MSHASLSPADFLWLLGSVCQTSHIPFSPDLVAGEYPPPHDVRAVLDGLRHLGFEARSRTVSPRRLPTLPTPFVALTTHPDEPGGCRPVLVLRVEGDRALWFEPGNARPCQGDLATLIGGGESGASYAGRVIQYRRRAEDLADPDAVAGQSQAFGFRWFIPVLLKHRELWRDVLLASLVIQLIGLATPLFTQVIIDKVIVHQSTSTLIVIGVALVIFMLFGALLTWTRQHLLILTGNRVDAVLGTAVFEHLFRLPLRYFERRPTGVIAARLHAVETVREFLAGSIVTLLLDIPFLLLMSAQN